MEAFLHVPDGFAEPKEAPYVFSGLHSLATRLLNPLDKSGRFG